MSTEHVGSQRKRLLGTAVTIVRPTAERFPFYDHYYYLSLFNKVFRFEIHTHVV